MRGIETTKTRLRRQVFLAIAKLAYDGFDASVLEELPHSIIPGEKAQYRDSVETERWIVAERARAALGLPLRGEKEPGVLREGELTAQNAADYRAPYIDIITAACNACIEERVFVTNACQGCLEQSCVSICPKGAVSIQHGRSVIDESKCVKCGLCIKACNYGAILKLERPCAKACGVKAISTNDAGVAAIDRSKCVSCGMCLATCPFGAIVDSSQLFQVISDILGDEPVYAAIAPSFEGQFGNVTVGQMRTALKALGFAELVQVATGADEATRLEAEEFTHLVPAHQPFLATSCCPGWVGLIKQHYPDLEQYISATPSPMLITARAIKAKDPCSKVVFIGPCVAKKMEGAANWSNGAVDYVLTFEELASMLQAKDIIVSACEDADAADAPTADGIGFAVGGGVSRAVAAAIAAANPDAPVDMQRAEGLAECRKLLDTARARRVNGCLLEGMACPGGCVGGAGVILPTTKAALMVAKRVRQEQQKEQK
ncbi:MAG: 4Fe-4S binding protein [Oscillospiraceae bacterium]|nr:4Fe-4S binding protein [Oscillospiraceae bacterium]